ncbi:MAG: hypothetical protein U9R14_00250 [Patescibacteria group bacterium]|nr:hypothetical protein [Patescibacteria group bacterium]
MRQIFQIIFEVYLQGKLKKFLENLADPPAGGAVVVYYATGLLLRDRSINFNSGRAD